MRDFESMLIDLLHDRKKRIYLIAGAVLAVLLIAAILAALLGGSGRKYNRYCKEAESAYLAGDYAAAEEKLRRAMELKSNEKDYLRMADIYCAEGETDRAIQILYLGYSHLGSDKIADRLEELKGQKGAVTPAPQQQSNVTIAGKLVDSAVSSLVLTGTRLKADDLTAIASLTRMENLGISDCGISDISFLSGLSGMTFLQISDNSVRDLTPIAGMKYLKTLYIDNNPISDFTPLYGLAALRTLSMKGIELSQTQLDALKEALPDCSIYADEPEDELREVSLGGRTFRTDVTELDLGGLGIADIASLTACTKLERLDLRDNQITDISPLVELPNLKWLCLRNNKVEDINPLLSLGGVEYLDAEGNSISDISVLEYMPQLKELKLNKNPLKSMEPLRRLTDLTRLGLAGTELEDDDLDCLMELKALRDLDIKDNDSISVGKFEDLQKALPNCSIAHDELRSTALLGDQELLTDALMVTAAMKDISDLTPLQAFTKLERLDLPNNSVSDLSPLAGLKHLKVLDLSNNKIENITPLAGCSALKELDLSGNSIADLSALADLTNLTTLKIAYNRVRDLTALYSLTGLKTLDLRGNPLNGDDIAALRTALPDCSIEYGGTGGPASGTDLR